MRLRVDSETIDMVDAPPWQNCERSFVGRTPCDLDELPFIRYCLDVQREWRDVTVQVGEEAPRSVQVKSVTLLPSTYCHSIALMSDRAAQDDGISVWGITITTATQ
jgi:hypothetical protein